MPNLRFFCPALICLLIALTSVAGAKTTTSAQDALAEALAPMVDAHRGKVALKFVHLPSGQTFAVDENQLMPAASLIKLPLMVAAYEAAATGRLSLDDRCVLTEDDKTPGAGILATQFSAGADLALRDVIRLMIAWSDNTATNLVIDRVGIAACNELMDRLGHRGLKLNSYVYRPDTSVAPQRTAKYGLGAMTPAETILLLKRLVDGDPFGAGPGEAYGQADAAEVVALRDEMLDHLRACQHDEMAPSLLPQGVVVAHKTGAVADTRCDAGVIESPTGPIAFCVMTAENVDRTWDPDNEAYTLIGEITKAAYTRFTKPGGAVEAPRVARVLRMGADGPLVEALQRTLNRRMKPSPELGVDGDFGPNTVKAVKRFQQEAGLETTGVVDTTLWKALGPLVMQDDPAPPPAEINTNLPPRGPADGLVGPPVATCKAWAIADGNTGEVLYGYNQAGTRDPASTTKIMPAYLIAKLAQDDPMVLQEVITFSERADNTSGSTAGVRVGEQVSAGELLYGLMLPSGNDASVALAEHFGGRFPEVAGGGLDDTPYNRFVAAMNAAADELGMTGTGYKNTHGLTDDGHVTTAEDLVKLAHAAMQIPVFREVVGTPLRGTTLDSVDGYQRNVVWKNSNRLLRQEGFYGVKTGTTGKAGACLVAAGERAGRPLYVVILGATSSDARYVDSRNLFRWAWKELGAE
ncbi:MAG: serine hydrolase [Planctomycetota bacterium]